MSHSQQHSGLVELPRPTADEVAAPSTGASPEERGDGAVPGPAAEPGAAVRAGRWVPWLLAAALAVCVLLLLQQVRRAELLEGRVASLSSELEGARGRLALYESRMSEVRRSVSELFGQVAGLRDLVAPGLPGEAWEGASPPPRPGGPETPVPGPSERPEAILPGTEGRPGKRL
jgi:hypothetical protein